MVPSPSRHWHSRPTGGRRAKSPCLGSQAGEGEEKQAPQDDWAGGRFSWMSGTPGFWPGKQAVTGSEEFFTRSRDGVRDCALSSGWENISSAAIPRMDGE